MSETLSCVLSDLHIPHHDPAAVACALSLLTDVQPDTLIWNGDILDNAPLSKYLKRPMEVLSLQQDLDAAKGLLKQFRMALPDTTFIFIEGNHEARTQKWLNAHPEVANLDCLRLENLLDLPALECDLEPVGYSWNGYWITHGDIVRAQAGYTAQAMIQKWGMDGISGHTHRAALIKKKNYSRSFTWIEGGCLCDLSPDYCVTPDWSHALTILESDGQQVWPHLIPITDGECRWEGLTHPACEVKDLWTKK